MILTIFFSTFLSEDLTCIAAGLLAKEGKIHLSLAILVTGLGIFVGDCLLYLLGNLVRRGFLHFDFFKKKHSIWQTKEIFTDWRHHYRKSIFLSRFLPGTRLPLYLSSGFFDLPFFPFLYTSLFAVSLWTTILVGIVFIYGNLVSVYWKTNNTILLTLTVGLSFYLLYQFLRLVIFQKERKNFFLFTSKILKLEFWPASLFYLPLLPYLLFLILRYRGIRYITTVNPGILASGIAGESKAEILNLIPKESVSSFLLVPRETENSISLIKNWMIENKIKFPIIAKPDKGERGFLIKKINSLEESISLLQTYPIDWLFQEYETGPYELGIFYYRFPKNKQGHIFSITDKIFPKIIGDGFSDLKTLIANHPRYRFQVLTHVNHNKHQLNRILSLGESISIGSIGNHIQGCMFQDGNHWRTSQLEKKIIQIGDSIPGFYFGRFDIRFSEPEKFKEGKDFKIIELNGATSESTNLYDPKFSIYKSYSILFGQWKILFQIGYENYKTGVKLYPYNKLYHLVKNHKKYKEKFSDKYSTN
ncbi:DedA family protein [Leptospira bandrabouensis]|uniref:DedA family protein n=1 Tax=Leptospira bandrabouensis TaxID=2484903 RepID=UPI001EEA21DF|nr:VTT domain-containing protein [Leptospira bandrabouensis]MCG6153072.1 VTT domain-containing protein [Leptospira bandrabouensis]